jgi:hypothetical protein
MHVMRPSYLEAAKPRRKVLYWLYAYMLLFVCMLCAVFISRDAGSSAAELAQSTQSAFSGSIVHSTPPTYFSEEMTPAAETVREPGACKACHATVLPIV